jgi:hypothetical protein
MCRPFAAADTDIPLDERVAHEATALRPIYPLVCRLAQLMMLVHGSADGSRPIRERQPAARTRFAGRLARIRTVVDDYVHRHGERETRRLRQRHILDLMRLDGAYRRFRPAQRSGGGGTDASVLRKVRRTARIEAELYRQTATLWAIVDEQLERARVELPLPPQFLSDQFRRTRGLERRSATLVWRRANNLDGRAYERLVAMDARLALVSAGSQAHALGLRPAIDPACWLVDAVRLAGLYARLRRRVSRADSATVAAPGDRSCVQE